MKINISVDALSRVEGEGYLKLEISGRDVEVVRFGLYEPPRLFEGFLAGRHYGEAVDFVARICGICPVAHQTSCSQAMEDALGLELDGPLRNLRRLIYCGEWIESHALHVFMLHAPDFLGYPDALTMAQEHRQVVEMGLRIKKAGNSLVRLVGGREIHPMNFRVGGFYQAPEPERLRPLEVELEWAVQACQDALRWLARLPIPQYERRYLFVSLNQPGEYPIDRGKVVTSAGQNLEPGRFLDSFEEYQVPYSTALHARHRSLGDYLVGPLARFNLNFDELSPLAREAALGAGLRPPVNNPFQSILVRGVELLYACQEALRLIRAYEKPRRPFLEAPNRAGRGYGVSEAPRGLLYHGYTLDGQGCIEKATIIPPTSQNQATIEADVGGIARANRKLGKKQLTRLCEQSIRNYDPCISCSTH
ncbi:MAG: Ni/Fe hydrogenase subunit alpha [Proteobacteria bacterium]|nr:Ni/Fe hydrogenase subunit alpha [Pseudomonadota bacterium]